MLIEKNPAARRLDRLVDRLGDRERRRRTSARRASSTIRPTIGATCPASTANWIRVTTTACAAPGDRDAGDLSLAARHGVRFYGPMPEPPHSQPRMHNVLPNSRAFITTSTTRHARPASRSVCGTRATALVRRAGRVGRRRLRHGRRRAPLPRDAAAWCWRPATSPTTRSSRRASWAPQEAKVDGVNPTATGDGQKLAAEALGARIVNGDLALGPELRFVAPSTSRYVRRCCRPGGRWPSDGSGRSSTCRCALLRPFVMSS